MGFTYCSNQNCQIIFRNIIVHFSLLSWSFWNPPSPLFNFNVISLFSVFFFFFFLFLYLKFFFILNEFIRVALVNKIIKVSSVQFYNMSSIYLGAYHPKWSLFSSLFIPHLPSSVSHQPPFPSGNYHFFGICVCVCVYTLFFCLILSPFSSRSQPSPLWKLSVCFQYL